MNEASVGIIEKLISAIHLEKIEKKPDRVLIGAYLAAVVVDARCGLATVHAEHRHGEDPVREPGSFEEKPINQLAGLALSDKPLEACLGMAAINAAVPTDPSRLEEKNSFNILAEKASGKNLTVVGHFPFAEELKPLCKNCWVLELEPKPGDLPAEAAEQVIPESDVVGVTASAFSNHTIDRLLELSSGKYVMVLGPTAPLSEILFEFGISSIAGTWVTDIKAAIRSISQGASFRQVKGVKKVVMEK
jgi:uncharacterized protein (DUF4213/DUF364 family)